MTIENIEYRLASMGALETRLGEDQDGTFSGYANLHEVTDSYRTRFARGAWEAGGLEGRRALLFMHSPDNPVGTFVAREDERGLFIEGRYDDTDEGQRARRRALSGSASELSVGFIRKGVDPDDSNLITAAELREVSAITLGFASQPGAELTAVRKAAEIMQEMDEQAETVAPAEVKEIPVTETPEPEVTEEAAKELDKQIPEPVEVSNDDERARKQKALELKLKTVV